MGKWSDIIQLPIVAVALANTPDGKIEAWVAGFRFIQAGGRTFTCTFDPDTNQCTERLIQNTNHDMFCPGKYNVSLSVVVTDFNSFHEPSQYPY